MQVAVPFAELVHATSNFAPSQILGRGGLGPVFTGRWREYDVAVKVCCTPFFWPSAAPRRARAAAHALVRSRAPLSSQQRRPRRDTAVATRPAVFACSRPPARRATPRGEAARRGRRGDARAALRGASTLELPPRVRIESRRQPPRRVTDAAAAQRDARAACSLSARSRRSRGCATTGSFPCSRSRLSRCATAGRRRRARL